MPRANSTVPKHRRHRKIVKLAKGYYGARKSNFRSAKDAVQKRGNTPIEIGELKKGNLDHYGSKE